MIRNLATVPRALGIVDPDGTIRHRGDRISCGVFLRGLGLSTGRKTADGHLIISWSKPGWLGVIAFDLKTKSWSAAAFPAENVR